MASEQVKNRLNKKLLNLVSKYLSAKTLEEKVDINAGISVIVSAMIMENEQDAKRLSSLVERLVK